MAGIYSSVKCRSTRGSEESVEFYPNTEAGKDSLYPSSGLRNWLVLKEMKI